METTLKDIKRIWLTEDAIHIESKKGKTANEYFADYDRLKEATATERKQYTTSEFGIHWPELDEDLSFEGFFKVKNEKSFLGVLFSKIPEINVSAFARKIGIAQPLLADYISGKKTPSEKQMLRILKGVHTLGKELQNFEIT